MYPSTKMDYYPGSVTHMPVVNNPGATMNSNLSNDDDDKYIVTTKIMVLALVVLFAVVFFVICLHIYAKWMWSTTPAGAPASFSFWPPWWRRNRNRAAETILDADMLDINLVVGLGKAAVEAIPTFRYKTAIEIAALECAICLGQFQEDEVGRTLPKCGHNFHLECIDMWLYSHSTCPLCRAVLEPAEDDSISLNLESSNIQVFRTERMSSTRRPRGMESRDPNTLPLRDEPGAGGESEHPPEQETTGNKRADSIPANVLFWGNLQQRDGADSRVVNNAPQQVSSSPIAADLAIAIDIVGSTTTQNRHVSVQIQDPVPDSASL